ncbi:exodeoxyribonuclease VII small subunit [Kangiella taiwanensis]|uniref:Exodeoxyribonuclease 7 small subunit n=1 Tax=Kangiella taiwanensis TaxID=1079179 RepID=A0ABP8I497_9GAMM|nr:exodeoxyribonuclease VII small subunit [Kangiella taiwanensis]
MSAKKVPAKQASKTNFETQLSELESIVEQLESGELPLEDALKVFEKGVKLSRQCQQMLSEAEQKVTILMDNDLMDSQEQDFDAPDE